MRIVSLYISSFGKIKDKTFEFEAGLNEFTEENGWGKTTFANFIKAMLYGIPYSRERKSLPERERFMPWGENTFGGSLTFVENGKTYRVERTFGKKDKDDTFKLIDVELGRESTDFSENLGEELFSVDRTSFENTVFFPQNALYTGMTSSMNAKLGDISSARDDIDKFEDAMSKLNDAKKKYTQNSKLNPGIIPKLKAEISISSEAKDRLPALDDAYNKQKEFLIERRKALADLNDEKKEISLRIAKQSEREQKLGEIKAKQTAHENTEGELKELLEFFRNDVPSVDEISDIEKKERDAEGLSKKLEQIKSTNVSPEKKAELLKLFPVGEPSDEEMQDFRDDEAKIRELKAKSSEMALPADDVKKLKDLRSFFSRHTPTEEELDTMQALGNKLITYDGKIGTLEEQFDKAKKDEENFIRTNKPSQSAGTWLFLILFIILILSSGLFVVLKYFLFSGIFLAASIAMLFLFFIFKKNAKAKYEHKKNELGKKTSEALDLLQQAEAEKEKSVNTLKAFLANYLVTPTENFQEMINEIRDNAKLLHILSEEERKHIENSSSLLDELSATTLKLSSKLSSFADVYELDATFEDNAHLIISKLSEDRLLFKRVKEEERDMKEYSTDLSMKEREVEAFIKKYISVPDSHAINDISIIRTKRLSYEELKKRSDAEKEELSKIALPEDEAVSVKNLQEREEEIDRSITELHHILEQEQQTLDKDSEEYGNELDKADRLSSLELELNNANKKVELIEKTEDYLNKAKENFLGRYMNPIRTALKKYLKTIDENYEEGNERISLDMDLNVSVVSNGGTHRMEYLSGGYMDLSNLSVRFALLDVLFPNEKPVLILDDPFVNLDAKKIDAARKLIRKEAEDFQIIYFTCHESRAV